MRRTVAAYVLLASLIATGTAGADECPAGALGVSRTLVVDPNEHVRLGSFQYNESLPLMDREVVLTFDDGPLPPYTNRILDTLASECVKATFFMVGRMVQGYPAVVRRVYNEGHTIANHSQTHPFTFHKMSVEQASQEIEGGFASLRSALGDPKAVAPFFRFPGLLRQDSVERAPEPKVWPRTLVVDVESPEPALAAPSPASFGIESVGPVLKVAMAQTFEQQAGAAPVWPAAVAHAVPSDAEVLPIPGAHNFRYSRVFRLGDSEKPKLVPKKPAVRAARAREPAHGGWFGPWAAPTRSSRTVGHQLTVARPPINLSAPQMR